MQTNILVTLLLILALSAVSGCNNNYPPTSKVHGTVHIDGKPLKKGGVFLRPSRGRTGKGRIEPDGSFVISTFSDGDGALIGPARIAVRSVVAEGNVGDREGGTVKWSIPEKFGSEDTSGLSCDVVAGKKNFFRIKITSDGTGEIVAE